MTQLVDHIAQIDGGLEPVRGRRGPYRVRRVRLPRGRERRYGSAVVHAPRSAAGRPFGAVAVVPGYSSPRIAIGWYGRRLASFGFVVITIGTLSRRDTPEARAKQLLAALDDLTTSPALEGIVDPERLAVMGHSMGGKGALLAALDRPSLRAVVALAPWSRSGTWQGLSTPTLVVGAERDAVAPVETHARAIYRGLPSDTPRAYLELPGASHYAPLLRPSRAIQAATVAWLRRFVDER